MITDVQVKNAKPKDKPYMIRDDRGLYLRVDPTGRKYWILRYWEAKREHQLSLGPYPALSLKDARTRRDEIQNARVQGISPRTISAPARVTFAEAAKEWWSIQMVKRSAGYQKSIRLRLKSISFPRSGLASSLRYQPERF